MDPAILSATSALIGSLIGGVSSFAASWLTQHRQLRIQLLLQEAAKRETLYAEFIIEASKRLTEAWGKQAEGSDVLSGALRGHGADAPNLLQPRPPRRRTGNPKSYWGVRRP
jgi:hypothetical protein